MESYIELLQKESSEVQKNELFRRLVTQLEKDLHSGTGGRVTILKPEAVTLNGVEEVMGECLKEVMDLPGAVLRDYLYRVDVSPSNAGNSLNDVVKAVLDRTTQKVLFRKRYSS